MGRGEERGGEGGVVYVCVCTYPGVHDGAQATGKERDTLACLILYIYKEI